MTARSSGPRTPANARTVNNRLQEYLQQGDGRLAPHVAVFVRDTNGREDQGGATYHHGLIISLRCKSRLAWAAA